jgi:predicted neutral ceramidase superfamily lipid hydrolase
MKESIGFFEDHLGNRSLMRLICFSCMLFSMLLTAYGVYRENLDDIYVYVLTYLIAATVPKALQKIFEANMFKMKPISSADIIIESVPQTQLK